MIGDGDEAPAFSLPAVEGGDFRNVALEDYLGEDIVVLAFYPADFNPCCDGETTDLDELDLFTMQKDVSTVGISGDSVYSHRAFAERYDLHIPLLADVDGDVARAYGVAVDDPDAGYRTNRAVVVIDPDGTVQYAWQTEKLTRLPPVDQVRRAVENIGGGDAAEARYRVGHAHYVEGRRAFTSAMGEFTDMEWMMAQGDFRRAREEFDEAADQFNTAVRFAVDETPRTYFERAEEKADALAKAAEWLAASASAYASGEGAEGEQLRSDAERPLETARDMHEPPDPDDFPPDDDPAEQDDEQKSILSGDDDGHAPTLDADVDKTVAVAGDDPPQTEPVPADGEAPAASDGEHSDGRSTASAEGDEEAGEDDGDEIDDEELEAIAAELEEQTKQAQAERAAEQDEEPADAVGDEHGSEPAPANGDVDAEGALTDEGTLDLTDPTEGEGEENGADDDTDTAPVDDDPDGESHGVPDSL
jgi:peroxiredoxin